MLGSGKSAKWARKVSADLKISWSIWVCPAPIIDGIAKIMESKSPITIEAAPTHSFKRRAGSKRTMKMAIKAPTEMPNKGVIKTNKTPKI